jgi:plasmid stabilization system protein ParE
MSYQIVWEDDSIEDRLGIFDLLFKNADEEVALRIDAAILNVVDGLAMFPYMGKEWQRKGRRIPVSKSKYSVYYQVDEMKSLIMIVRVLHDRRK